MDHNSALCRSTRKGRYINLVLSCIRQDRKTLPHNHISRIKCTTAICSVTKSLPQPCKSSLCSILQQPNCRNSSAQLFGSSRIVEMFLCVITSMPRLYKRECRSTIDAFVLRHMPALLDVLVSYVSGAHLTSPG
jgi:hypothetical protein